MIFAQKILNHCVYKPSVVFYALAGVNALYVNNKFVKKFNSTLSGGSLGLWVDEERSKLRVDMWTAGHMNIDILNAYCGPYWFVSFIRSCMDHTWLRVVRLLNKNCIFITIGCFWQSFLARYTAKIALVNHLEISIFWYTKYNHFYSIERRLNLTLYRKSSNEHKCILNKFF